MNEHERPGDPAFDRLMAADPAKRSPDPVPGVLRAKVDALIAERTERESADELAVRRHRRRTPWLVAAAVAGIVAAGGGGYVAGESGLRIVPTAETASEGGGEESVMSGTTESQPDEKDDAMADAGPQSAEQLDAPDDLAAPQRLVFHAGGGLSDEPATAQVRVAGTSGESLGSYPVVSEVEAVERLGDPRFAGAVLGQAGQTTPEGEAEPPAAAPAPAPGGPLAWPVEDVTIVSATLTEARYTLPDGTVLFVPAYYLADAAGSSWTVMAVDEEVLDFAP
jgi:hypothetical protein